MVDETTARRVVRFTRGNISDLEPGELPKALLDGAGLLLIDGRMPSVQAAAAERARAMSIPILLDARHLGAGMGELLDLCDVVIGSERFAAEISRSSDIGRSLIELTKMGPRVAVLTLGEEGAIGLEGEKLVRQGAIDVDVQDTSGASDVFRGAFAYALVHGWPLERSLPFANAAAGLNCRHLGGLAGIPSLAEVLRTAGIEPP
jgi:sugar/nucleoside kinase (ribokinase family)